VKVVCMIPARLGSTRVKNKNLRLINGKPLVRYIIESAVKADSFQDIYLNSESTIFKEIADDCGVQFYQRPKELSSDSATNDDFALDFMDSVECDIFIQILPTSPFITPQEIDNFVQTILDGNYDTLVSVTNVQIESIYKQKPINFDQKKQTPPSQLLEPVKAYACGLMGWRCENFRGNIKKYGAAYHGGDGRIGFFTMKGYSTIDIDNEEDFILAEAVVEALSKSPSEPAYYDPLKEKLIFDADVERILSEDGVEENTLNDYNNEQVPLKEITARYGREKSWSHVIVNSLSNCATLIAQMPGEGNRMHFHPDWDEWWYIIEGEWEWIIDGVAKTVKPADFVFIKRNRKHKITAIGNKMAIRLAVSRNDVDHVYEEDDYKNI
jgi:CMP-N-acetylneuraminic acid synthetase/quercetin dioxygenase-like cupin family protein